MGESHSGYQLPQSDMEDVPIGKGHNENPVLSRPRLVKPNGKPTPCLDIANHWDFFKRYKTSVFTAIISVVALLFFSAAMIYMSLQSTENFSTLPVETIVEEIPVTEEHLTNEITEDFGKRGHNIRRYLYEIVPETVVRMKKREIRKRPKRNAGKMENNPQFAKEIYKDINEQRNHDKRQSEREEKMTACQKRSEHCKSVLESMQSIVKKAGENVDSLSKLVQQIRLNEDSKNPDPKFQDFLQCVECGKMAANNPSPFIQSESEEASGFHAQHHSHPHAHPQMKNMSAVTALLDNSSSASDETEEKTQIQDLNSQTNQNSNTQVNENSNSQTNQNLDKNVVVTTFTQKPGSNVQKTVEVTKTKKSTDGTVITEIIKNTTIIKTSDGKTEKETQVTEMSSGSPQPETSTAGGLNFDSLTPVRPRPTMQIINGASGPTGPDVVSSSSRFQFPPNWPETPIGDFDSEINKDSRGETEFYEGPNGEIESADQNQARVMGASRISNSEGNPAILPTAETMKTGQQVQYTPYMPYSICYFGTPPSGSSSGSFKQTMPGMMPFPASSPGNYPFPGNQFPMRGFGYGNQGFMPMQFQQQQGMSFGPMAGQFQQGNVQVGSQQSHRVGPSGPGAQNFVPHFGNSPTGPGASARTPYYCTYMTAPTFQFPTIPGVSDFQRAADNPTDVVGNSAKQYGIPQAVWNGDGLNYPGYPGDCDHNSHRCLDGSRCIPKNLWCDGSVDCPDASDETRCSCRDRITKDRLCDGYFDCPRGEDELGCFGCPANSFSCEDWSRRYRRENCVPLSNRCDGLQQCSNGKDEMDCAILTESYIEDQNSVTIGYTSGWLHKNWKGRWYPVCTRTPQWAIDACSSENDSPIRETPLIQVESIPNIQYRGPYLAQSTTGEIKLVPTCFNKAIHVTCPEIPCGTRVLSHESFSPFGPFDDSLVASVKNPKINQTNDGHSDGADGNGKDEILGVVGGRASQPKAWPFLVGIYKDGYFHCGGSIINKEWILTAAHCVDGFRQHYYEIQAGLLRRFSYSPMAQIRRAKYIKMHPRYDRKTMKNDLALIRLNEQLRFNRWIRPTCLPKKASFSPFWRSGPYPDTTCVIVGWGATAEHGPDPDHLREVEVPILPECKHLEDRNEAEICAGMPQGGRDACQGDSGGPLMCKYPDTENQWYVAGIVSHGDGCARPNEPGAYTKVSQFVDWIDETIRTREIFALGPKPMEICPGFSCAGGLGKCLPRTKRCDRTVNCLDAEDEMHCLMFQNYSPLREAPTMDHNQKSHEPNNEIVGQSIPDFSEITKTQNDSNHVIESKVENVTTLQDNSSQSVFTINDEETSTTTSKTVTIATPTPATQKNISDATSASALTTKPPIITTIKPQSSSRRNNEINYVPRFTCTRVLQTVSIDKRCNRVLDCEDGTDEDNCTCKDYLANLHPVAICDGHVDCYDGSDEENCAFCKEDEFICSRSGNCISQTNFCDHHIDCPHMEDELDCFALTNGNDIIVDFDKRPHLNLEGVVTERRKGKWRPVCQKQNKSVQTRLSHEFCVYFGFGAPESIEEVPVWDSPIEVHQSTMHKKIPYEYPPSYARPHDPSKTCLGLYLRCKPILSTNTSNLIVTNPTTNDVAYLLPWQAHIFVDGHYHCPAMLLEYSWLLASSKCAENLDLTTNYTVALLGTSPPYLYVDGPYQQTAVIDSIQILKKLDATMMHLKTPINMTRYVQPIFAQKKIVPATSNDVCLATGINNKHETKTVYLNSVPRNCPPCHRCYRNATFEDCKNNKTSENWSGTVACRGSGIWYPAAIFHEKDLHCGFRSPQTLASIDYGYADFTQIMDTEVQSTPGPNCDGLRCPLGKCVPWNSVCDGIEDCRDGADENTEYCAKKKELCETTKGLGCKCAKSELRCANGQCVPKEAFCDSINDCSDHSDEPATCNCAAYLKLTAPHLLCDNVRHCLDKSDENNEHCFCKDASFKCKSNLNVTESCISHDFVCDGEKDCANGNDEKTCRRVKGTLKDPPGTGEVLRRSYGVWQTECFPGPLSTGEISELCKTMGYDFGTKLEFENGKHPYGPAMSIKLDEFYMIRFNSNAWVNMRARRPLVSLVPATEPCHRAFVKCTSK